MIEACEGTGEEFAVLCVDLDGLKEVNDVFGHALGDKLLIEVAKRLQDSGALAAWWRACPATSSGLIIDGKQPDAGLRWPSKVAEALAEFRSTASGAHGAPPAFSFSRIRPTRPSLLANAGAALFRAKQIARHDQHFEPEMDQQIRDRRVLHQDLSLAIRTAIVAVLPAAGQAGQTVASSESPASRAGALEASGARFVRRPISFRWRKRAA
jgi:predicted signal transduction protein with EAL and GGDEF domain